MKKIGNKVRNVFIKEEVDRAFRNQRDYPFFIHFEGTQCRNKTT